MEVVLVVDGRGGVEGGLLVEDALSAEGRVGRRGVGLVVFPERVGLGDIAMLGPFVSWVMVLWGCCLRPVWGASFPASCLQSPWAILGLGIFGDFLMMMVEQLEGSRRMEMANINKGSGVLEVFDLS